MERKIVKQGGSTMTISLPAEWTRKFGLADKDVVHVAEVEKNLIISTDKFISSKESTVDVRGRSNSYLARKIFGLYQIGEDKITILYEKSQDEYISKVVSQLIGFATMSKIKDRVVIEDIAGVSSVDFENVYKRCFLILVEQYDFLEMKIRDGESLDSLDKLDYNLNQFTDFALRYLSKRGHEIFRKTPAYYHIISQLELIGDVMTRVADVYDEKAREGVLFLILNINELVQDLYKVSVGAVSEKNSDIVMKCKALEDRFFDRGSSLAEIQLVNAVTIIKDLFNTVLAIRD
jgi:phosphate uptake regulator